jgi:stearoyl-CoA desaturase (delta-9 desaturase)
MSVTLDQETRTPRAGAKAKAQARATGRDPSTWAPNEHINRRSSIPFIALHFLPLLAFVTGVTWKAVWLGVILYFVRMLGITAGYHRYFSHRSYRLGRVSQFVLAFVGLTAAQKGPMWWAAHHRAHHKNSDTEQDIHSPIRGFWWSHVGWILCDKYNKTDSDAIKDFTRYPELVWLDKHDWVGPWSLGVACYLIAGWSGLIIGFFASTIVLWHATFCVNSLAHVLGRRVYDTTDTSRNSTIVALITSGEGWHNNHHRYPWAARQGFRWWQIDVTYYVLRLFSFVGIVRDLRPVPRAVRDEARALELAPKQSISSR